MENVIIMEGDTGVARMSCGCCGRSFRAYVSRVTTADKSPVCLPCIIKANPIRIERGMGAIPYDKYAYLSDTEKVPSY